MAPAAPFIFVSGTIGEERAIDALRAGACDYVLKNNLLRLAPAVKRALADTEMRLERVAAGGADRATGSRPWHLKRRQCPGGPGPRPQGAAA